MALLYIGPRNAPDLHSDFHISPIFTPPHMLARFPPVYMSCGERDPLVDDVRLLPLVQPAPSCDPALTSSSSRSQTVIFAGKLREAKEARKLELLARESRHGAGLRMSSSSSVRDPILDEDEDDWVRTSIIAGWSHGYLQMVSLLPAADKVIAMHADWIAEAFERATAVKGRVVAAKVNGSTSSSSTTAPPPHQHAPTTSGSSRKVEPPQPIQIVPPTPTLEQAPSPPSSRGPHSPDIAVAEAEDDDEVLSFTPKRRRGSSNTSRTTSPGPTMHLPSKTMPSMDGVLFGRPRTPSGGSSDRPSPSPAPTSPARASHPPSHLVTPVERALREGLRDTSLARAHSSPSTPAPPRAQSVTPGGGAAGERTLSPQGKAGRSSSSGSLPAPQGAVFIDAKELLRRRRDDVVSGISVHNSRNVSRAGSGSEDDGAVGDEEGDERAAGARFARRRTSEH